jgi:hypothetical protein
MSTAGEASPSKSTDTVKTTQADPPSAAVGPARKSVGPSALLKHSATLVQKLRKASIQRSQAVSQRRTTLHNRVHLTIEANLGINIICFSSTGKQRRAFDLNLAGPALQRLEQEYPHIQPVLEMLCVSLTSNDIEEANEAFRQVAMAHAALLRWQSSRTNAPASPTADPESDQESDEGVDEALAQREELLQQVQQVPITPTPPSRRGRRGASRAGLKQGAGGATTSMGSQASGAEVGHGGEQPAATTTAGGVEEGGVPSMSGRAAGTVGIAAPTSMTVAATATEPQQQQEVATGNDQVRLKPHKVLMLSLNWSGFVLAPFFGPLCSVLHQIHTALSMPIHMADPLCFQSSQTFTHSRWLRRWLAVTARSVHPSHLARLWRLPLRAQVRVHSYRHHDVVVLALHMPALLHDQQSMFLQLGMYVGVCCGCCLLCVRSPIQCQQCLSYSAS